MSIKHKFLNTDFNNGFKTTQGILEVPYKPEVLILGTFNPNTPNSNFADFFYGRNYFWPGFKNLVEGNYKNHIHTRMPKRGKIKLPLTPDINEIKDLCFRFKLTFADLITEVMFNGNNEYQIIENDNIVFENQIYNLIQDGKKNNIGGLAQLDNLNQVRWNTNNIVNFIRENPSIRFVYFTRQPTGVWKKHWDSIRENFKHMDCHFTNIFTPSGQGAPVLNSMERLLNHWLHNNNDKFGNLDKKWLSECGVDLTKFKID